MVKKKTVDADEQLVEGGFAKLNLEALSIPPRGQRGPATGPQMGVAVRRGMAKAKRARFKANALKRALSLTVSHNRKGVLGKRSRPWRNCDSILVAMKPGVLMERPEIDELAGVVKRTSSSSMYQILEPAGFVRRERVRTIAAWDRFLKTAGAEVLWILTPEGEIEREKLIKLREEDELAQMLL